MCKKSLIMKRKLLTYLVITIFGCQSSMAQNLVLNAYVGGQRTSLKLLDQYNVNKNDFIPGSQSSLILGVGLNYHWNSLFYSGVELEYTSLEHIAVSFGGISFQDFNGVNAELTPLWGIGRKHLISDLILGFKVPKTSLFIETGLSYGYNFLQKMSGYKENIQYGNIISTTNLSDVDYGSSGSFGYFFSVGLKLKIARQLSLLVVIRQRIEQASTPGIKTKFKIGYTYKPSLSLGFAYSFNKKKEKEVVE